MDRNKISNFQPLGLVMNIGTIILITKLMKPASSFLEIPEEPIQIKARQFNLTAA